MLSIILNSFAANNPAKNVFMIRLITGSFIVMTIISLQCCKPKKETAAVETKSSISVAFYNVENLFDTEDDPLINDEEFTPEGKKKWDAERLDRKISNVAKVLSSLDEELPDVIGLCEVENRAVVEMLVANEQLASAGYEIVHRDSPDGRGIDVALVYNPDEISVIETSYVKSQLPSGDRPNTRLAQYTKAVQAGDTLHFFVNHWPSRYGGQEKSEPNRLTVARNVDIVLDSIRKASPEARIVLMGDFNDYPNNKSLNEIIGAGIDPSMPFYNLMWDKHKAGDGSYNYKGEWGCLDQFVVSQPMISSTTGFRVSKDAAKIIRHDWMMYVNDKGEVYPNRTYGGPNYYGGYSDHLPIILEIQH